MLVQCLHDITTSYGLVFSLFLAGLVGGFTHCAGMCGPFVLAQVSPFDETKGMCVKRLSQAVLLPYHMGRMTTYVALAVSLSSFLNLAFLFLPIKNFIAAPILFLAGVVFLISAFPRLSTVFPWAVNLRVSLPYRWFSQIIQALTQNPGVAKRYFLGMLLGFMPCGLVISALMAATTASTVLYSGVAMAVFALGTLPALILTAIGGHALKTRYPHALKRINQGLMVCSSLWLFALASWMLM